MAGKLIYFIVGEPSGDILVSRLMRALREKAPDVRFAGTGGETMTEAGFESLFPVAELSVMGFWEVAPRLPLILKRMKQVILDIEAKRPDVLVTVDSWGFVSKVLQRLKKRGVCLPKVHYVAPQVWAWKKSRAPKAAGLIDHLMTLLPYEPPYFEKYGLKCTFVGHPVIENTARLPDDQAEFKARYGIPERCTLLAVLPGSRHSEVSKLAPVFGKVIRQLAAHFPDLFLLLPTVEAIAGEVETAFAGLGLPCRVITGQYERYSAFKASRFALAASGTVSLELAACGVPHVIAYKFNFLTNKIIKHLAITPYANLINILAGRFVIPEFVLENCTYKLIAPAVLELLQHPDRAQAQADEAGKYMLKLKPENATPSGKAAEVVLSLINS
ncbi:MAG: lipid-A-disaccharide synthase [Bacteroidales bacterium]|jgi:lipid-A-disaccharide synthase|nr:lipid-A-disaccharide synthase [Bacteroidales bacterium]